MLVRVLYGVVSLERSTRAEPDAGTGLPAIVGVRTRVVEESTEGAVVVRFANGARLRYRETAAGIEEAWVPPDGDPGDPAVTHAREADVGTEALALRTIGEYLSFDDRRRAEFVWGETNVAVLLGT
jgi:hypothetical protein